jgi:hypothetical protein
MLELIYSSNNYYLNLTIFPKTALFLNGISINEYNTFKNFLFKSKVENFICELKYGMGISFKDFLFTLISPKRKLAKKVLEGYFDKTDKFLQFLPLFCKESRVWLAVIKDLSLTSEEKYKIAKLLSSKIINENSIIIYMTESGIPLEIEEQINYFFS